MSAFFGRMNNRRYQRWSMEKTPRVSLYRKKICFAKDTLKRSERKPPKHVIAIGQGGKNNFVGRTVPGGIIPGSRIANGLGVDSNSCHDDDNKRPDLEKTWNSSRV